MVGTPRPVPAMVHLFSGAYTYPVEEFLAVADACMAAAPDYYCTPERKRVYVAAALAGRARLWFTNWAKHHISASYEEFRSALLDEFHIDDAPTEQQKFRHLTQGISTVACYAREFETAACLSKEEVETQYNRLRFAYGLNRPVSGHVLERFAYCPTFKDLVNEAKHIEEHFKTLHSNGNGNVM